MSSDELKDLRRRVEQLEDERELRYMIGRYGHYCDLGYHDEWISLWTPDGVYDLVTVKRDGAGYDGGMRFEGHEALYGMLRDPTSHQLFEGRSLHIQDINLVIRIDGDEAFAHGYSITMLREGEAVNIRTAGMVRWAFKRIDGKWYFTEKKRRKVGDGSAFADVADYSPHDAAKPAAA
jgi:hypothetical protein